MQLFDWNVQFFLVLRDNGPNSPNGISSVDDVGPRDWLHDYMC